MPRLARFIPLVASLPLLIAPGDAARAATTRAYERSWIAAGGVSDAEVDSTLVVLEGLAAKFAAGHVPSGDIRSRAKSIHDFLHRRVLTGTYRADASNLAVALDGGAFNCAAATALFLVLAERAGVEARAVSTRGHVWCRVSDGQQTFDIETTCRDWFAVVDGWQHLPDEQVPTAMVTHRQRVRTGRELTPRELVAVFHFNRGVTHLRHNQLDRAMEANLTAMAYDPQCRPASENFTAVVRHLAIGAERQRLFWKVFTEAWNATVQARSASRGMEHQRGEFTVR
jgi:hypothetical protein